MSSSNNSSFTATTITYSGWLMIDDKGGMRLTRDRPKVYANERPIRVKVAAPKSLWEKPEMTVHIEVLEGQGSVAQAAVEAKAALEGVGLTVEIAPTAVTTIQPKE